MNKDGPSDGEDHEIVQVPYREAIGSLMYAMIGSRPDIAYAVGFLSKFCEARRVVHWNTVKRVFRYLRDTAQHGLLYGRNHSNSVNLECYVDADFAGEVDSQKSTTGYVIIYCGTADIWKSSKQSLVATSTTEAEFIAASMACREVLWARQLMRELGQLKEVQEPTTVYVDNRSVIKRIMNSQIHARTKHIDISTCLYGRRRQEERLVLCGSTRKRLMC